MHATRTLTGTLAILATAMATGPAGAVAAILPHGARIIETTSGGYTLTVGIDRLGETAHLAISCPNGHSLGTSARFDIHRGRFTAMRTLGRKRLFRFSGYFDQLDHVRGSGSVTAGACGPGGAFFSEGAIGPARMLSCPASSPESPLAPDTPYPVAGIVPNAALGTRLRLEYTDPNSRDGDPAVVHVSTDSGGRFTDTHTFAPSKDGTVSVYGANATPRHPDDPLAPGIACDMQVQG